MIDTTTNFFMLDAATTDFIWKVMVYGAIGLVYGISAIHSLYKVISCKIAQRRGEKMRKPDCAFNMALYIGSLLFMLIMMQKLVNRWTHPAILYSAFCLIFLIICTILHEKIISEKRWKEIMEGCMGWIISIITKARNGLEAINKTMGKWFWWLIVVGFIALAGWGVSIQNYYLSIPLFLLIAFGGLLKGMHSCRSLLWFWFILYMALLTVCYSAVMRETDVLQPVNYVLFETLFTVLLCFVWSFMIGVADHDVGKLAAQVVNTITTIAGIILGVSVAFGTIYSQALIWNTVQAAALYVLLPFVIAGYVAALFKAIQMYWEKKHGQIPGAAPPKPEE